MAKKRVVNSLRRRILVTTYGTILFFLLLAGLALDNAFQRVIRENIKNNLQNLTFSLLASAVLDGSGHISVPVPLLPNDLKVPQSGQVAVIIDERGEIEWRSPSSLGENLPLFTPLKPGEVDFLSHIGDPDLPFVYRFGSVWSNGLIEDKLFTFMILERKNTYFAKVGDYRETMVQWLGGGSLLILLFQGLALLRELRPLKRVVREIDAIEHGSSDHIRGEYPSELALLTERINQFIRKEREQLARYRHGLDDLAHSLKTPLAVIRGLQQDGKSEQAHSRQLNEQVARMTDIIDYQLKRAASAGRNTLGHNQVPLCPVIEKTLASLDKVYADKQVRHRLHCAPDLLFPGDKDDLYEIIGNLADNAYKWAARLVAINCAIRETGKQSELIMTVEDDGPGFSLASEQQITQRGVRADEQVPGQGIGLAVVQNIVQGYEGSLRTDKSPLGGALIELRFPV